MIRIIGFILFFSFNNLLAQTSSNGCIDSSRIQPGQGYCGTNFEPVCGCNNKTYNNDCIALSQGLNTYTQGPCEPIAVNFYPNPLISSTLSIDVILKYANSPITVIVSDLFGKYYYYQKYTGFTRQMITLNASTFEGGMYLLIFQTTGYSLTKKLVVPVLR